MGGPGFSFVPTTSTSGGGTTYTGTADQVIVTGTVLSTPQDIATTSTPQFGGLGIGVAGVANKLMMPSGGIIDFNAADITVTHSADTLTFAGGVFVFPDGTTTAPGIQIGATNPSQVGLWRVTASTILAVKSNNADTVSFYSPNMYFRSDSQIKFNSTAVVTTDNSDVNISRQGIGVLQVGTTGANALGDLVTAGYVTAGSGTGVTVNATGYLRRHVYKVTVTYAALAAAAVDADKTIATLPKKTRLTGIIADTTVPYTGGAVSAATMVCGNGTTGDDCSYLASIDVLSATSTKGLLDADLGTKMTRAAAIQGGCVPSWSLTGPVNIRITTAGANTNALTAGCTEFYLITESLNT